MLVVTWVGLFWFRLWYIEYFGTDDSSSDVDASESDDEQEESSGFPPATNEVINEQQ